MPSPHPNPLAIDATFLPGAQRLLESHARELPQKDDLCGAFCAALALRGAGIEAPGGAPIDQDVAALAAGSLVATEPDTDALPPGEPGRRDYRVELPRIDEAKLSGTTAAGVARAVELLSDGRLVALAYRGPWYGGRLDGLYDAAAALERPVALLANFATRHLWGARPPLAQLLGYLLDGAADGPPADWDVGHFGCVVGAVRGPAGRLYVLADTYRAIGYDGVHLQPAERLVTALERRDMPAGGIIVAVHAEDAPEVRAAAAALGLAEGLWDNGTAAPLRVSSEADA